MGGGTHRAPPMGTGVGGGGGGDRTPGWGAMGQRWRGESHCGPMESSFSPQSCCSPQIPTDPQNANAAPPDPNVTPPRPHPTPPAAGSSAVPGLISLFFRRGDLGLINPNPAWGGGVGGGGSTDAALIHPGLPSPQRGTPKISLLGSPWAGCTLRYPIPVMSPKRG